MESNTKSLVKRVGSSEPINNYASDLLIAVLMIAAVSGRRVPIRARLRTAVEDAYR